MNDNVRSQLEKKSILHKWFKILLFEWINKEY
jgi:hypothetical protein